MPGLTDLGLVVWDVGQLEMLQVRRAGTWLHWGGVGGLGHQSAGDVTGERGRCVA